MFPSIRWTVVAALVAVTTFTTPLRAEPPGPLALPLHVLAVQTDDADDQAEALTAALKTRVREAQGWSLAEDDFSWGVLSVALKCSEPPDASCEQRVADRIRVDRYVWGVVRLQGAEVKGSLHLWTRGRGSTRVDIAFASNVTEAADDGLARVTADALARLTGGPPRGTVHIRAGELDGHPVLVDGKPQGRLVRGEATLEVAVGPRRVKIKAPGYDELATLVHVKPLATSEVILVPVRGGEKDEDGASTNFRKVGGYFALGVGGALLVGGVVAGLEVRSIDNDAGFERYRSSFQGDVDVCEAAARGETGSLGAPTPNVIDDMCRRGRTLQVVQFLGLGLGAASAGLGVYLLATGDAPRPTEARGISLRPSLGRDGGRVELSGRF